MNRKIKQTLVMMGYYVAVVRQLLVFEFWKIPLLLVSKKPVLIRTIDDIYLYMSEWMDYIAAREVLVGRCYEKFKKVKKGNIVIDIGAGIGDFSIHCSKIGATVYSYEMNTEKFLLLKRNSIRNAAHLVHSNQKKVTSLNNIISNIPGKYCDFIKIDTEGSEYSIIKNTPISILKRIKYFAFEIHIFTPKQKKQYQLLKKRLRSIHYSIKEISHKGYDSIMYMFAYRR